MDLHTGILRRSNVTIRPINRETKEKRNRKRYSGRWEKRGPQGRLYSSLDSFGLDILEPNEESPKVYTVPPLFLALATPSPPFLSGTLRKVSRNEKARSARPWKLRLSGLSNEHNTRFYRCTLSSRSEITLRYVTWRRARRSTVVDKRGTMKQGNERKGNRDRG